MVVLKNILNHIRVKGGGSVFLKIQKTDDLQVQFWLGEFWGVDFVRVDIIGIFNIVFNRL